MSPKRSPASTTQTTIASRVLSLFRKTERCRLPGLRPTLSFYVKSVSSTALSRGLKLSRLTMFAEKTRLIFSTSRKSVALPRIRTRLKLKSSKTNRTCQPQRPILKFPIKLNLSIRFLKAATTLRLTPQSTL